MIHVTATDLRKRLAHYLDRAIDDRDHLLVTRQGGIEPVVMVPLREWEGMQETLYLRSTPANAAALDASIAQAERGEFVDVTLDDLHKGL